MRSRIKILYAVSECRPYAGTGGLGEVAGTLPGMLDQNLCDIIRVMPLYRNIDKKLKYKWDFAVKIKDHYETCIIKYDPDSNQVPTYFVCNDRYFNRDSIYGYYDDGERYMFFCRAVLKLLEYIKIKPDIIHCNDWHTGIIPMLVKAYRPDIKTIYTIHNIKYQGAIGGDYIEEDEAKAEEIKDTGYPDMVNFMKSGILFSDMVTTPSPSYAQEILTPEYAYGMDGILRNKKDQIKGILNGIDTNSYDPEKTGDIYKQFNIQNIVPKKENKEMLKRELGLKTEGTENTPLIVSVTRLDDQKGIDLIIQALEVVKKDFQYVVLGSGNMYYERIFGYLSKAYPGKIAALNEYDELTAKKIYAAGDIYLMPSKYEPGGLSQLYAMRYGCVPVVRSTGGLKDTVADYLKNKQTANGFQFDKYLVSSLVDVLNIALDLYGTKIWTRLVRNAMQSDWSWKRSAAEYEEIYKSIL